MTLYDLLSTAAEDNPNTLAVICGNKHYSYTEFRREVDALADNLKALGILVGDRIAMIHENCHRYLETYFAAARIGAILVPINYRQIPDDFIYILNHSKAKILIAQSGVIDWIPKRRGEVPELEQVIVSGGPEEKGGQEGSDASGSDFLAFDDLTRKADVGKSTSMAGICKDVDVTPGVCDGGQNDTSLRNSDIAQIYYTSGTTGKPKGVILTHGNNLAHAEGTIRELGLSSRDRWLHVSPMFHLADAWAVWSITQVCGTHIVIPGFEPKLVLETIEKHRVTLTNFIPTMLNILVNHQMVNEYDFSSLRVLLSGGAPIAKEVVRKVMAVFNCEYIQTYGLTETSPFLTMSILEDWMRELPFEERLAYQVTTGRPFYNVDLKVVRGDGAEVAQNRKEVGEIIVRGDTITPGYWNAPEITEKRIVDGWLHTRDLAVVNSEGYVTIVDRVDDMIITGGENVYSVEVEDVLYSHPDVFEAAVVGIPDQLWGERVVAVIVPKEGRTPSEGGIIAFCKERMASYKAPKNVYFVDELPKTGSSKIRKFALREMLVGD